MADLTDKEIIQGLMLKLADENVNCGALVKRIGMKNYKKMKLSFHPSLNAWSLCSNAHLLLLSAGSWDKAYRAALYYGNGTVD